MILPLMILSFLPLSTCTSPRCPPAAFSRIRLRQQPLFVGGASSPARPPHPATWNRKIPHTSAEHMEGGVSRRRVTAVAFSAVLRCGFRQNHYRQNHQKARHHVEMVLSAMILSFLLHSTVRGVRRPRSHERGYAEEPGSEHRTLNTQPGYPQRLRRGKHRTSKKRLVTTYVNRRQGDACPPQAWPLAEPQHKRPGFAPPQPPTRLLPREIWA